MRVVLGLVACVALVACESSRAGSDAPSRRESARAPAQSTVTRADYIGPTACGECHPEQHAAWRSSLHRVMNARAEDAGAVIGMFDGAPVAYAGGEARFSRDGDAYVMTLARGEHRVAYRVTRTIGRRGLQEYVGVELGNAAAVEVRLPFGWWPRMGGWFPQVAFDPWLDEAAFDPYKPVREPWAERCPWCHSTYPFEQRIARAQTSHVGHGLEQLFAHERRNERSVRDSEVHDQVTVGISCESCHLGGRAHAAGAAIHFVPSGAPVEARSFARERKDAAVVNAVCAQCHSGPSPRLADGTALRNSSEAIDLAASPCTGIRCTDCHDPHRADARGDEARAIAACSGCHPAQAQTAHAGRDHATTSCLDCHMPRTVMGIDRYVRTHRISSPGEPAQLAATNACNLCHLDRSIGWAAVALRDGWDVKPAVTGDVETAAGELWLASDHPAVRLVAAHAYARSPLGPRARPLLERGLHDPLAYVRAWTQLALEQL